MWKVDISVKRVQSYIFEVPRLKAMLGANALIGEAMRAGLTELMCDGVELEWPSGIALAAGDPLSTEVAQDSLDLDNPPKLFRKGILARDGGHFIALFPAEEPARTFAERAGDYLAEHVPGARFATSVLEFLTETPQADHLKAQEVQLFDLPPLQICEETGAGVASVTIQQDSRSLAVSVGVAARRIAARLFRGGKTRDLVGLLRGPLGLADARRRDPKDLKELCGTDYLALIHMDGNGVGLRYKRYRECMSQYSTDATHLEAFGESFFHSMRVAVRCALKGALSDTFQSSAGIRPYEVLMLGGDDVLIACQGSKALEFASTYACKLSDQRLADGKPLDVAIGVAISAPTYPIHRLYELAESLAESAKRLYRALPDESRASVIDWQVVTQSWFDQVAQSRRQSDMIEYLVGGKKETLYLTGKPYVILRQPDRDSLQALCDSALELREIGEVDSSARPVARSALRNLRSGCEIGRLSAEVAVSRLGARAHAALSHQTPAGAIPSDGEDRPIRDKTVWREVVNGEFLLRALDIVELNEIRLRGEKT